MAKNKYKEAAERAKVAPGGDRKPHTEETVVESVAVTEEPTVKVGGMLAEMLQPKSEGKSYTFYLSPESYAKLEKFAKENKCSKSKAVDLLLGRFL